MNITNENHRGGGSSNTNMLTQPQKSRQLVLFPMPFQGHINPMLQLANILHARGFGITIIHTEFNSPNISNYPHFTFKSISISLTDCLSKIKDSRSSIDIGLVLTMLNEISAARFTDCLAGVLTESEESIACVITDALWYFTQAVTDGLKLPRIVLRTSSLSAMLGYGALPLFLKKCYFNLPKPDSQSEEPVPEFPPLKVKDVLKITGKPEGMSNLVTNMFKETKKASGIIWNTFRELEEDALETICQEFPIPNFTIGPFHKYFPASSSSLLEQDQSCISWLDLQAPKSVIYVSFGSAAQIDDSEFQEMAWALANSTSPFLWVVRPGLVRGSEWLESLPESFSEDVGDRGSIVKWAPQHQVLAHPATGCFWTHCGWNSTLESICEGVPMICSPCFVDQPINARYISDVWKIGVLLENGLEREEIKRAMKRVMVDKQGKEMRKRIDYLKQKASVCLEEGGSSHRSLETLVDYILSL